MSGDRYPGGYRRHGATGPVDDRMRVTARGLGLGLVLGATLAVVVALVLMGISAVAGAPWSDGTAEIWLLVAVVAAVVGAGLGLVAQLVVAVLLHLLRRIGSRSRVAWALGFAVPPAVAAGVGARVVAAFFAPDVLSTLVAVVATSLTAAGVAVAVRSWTTRPLSPAR